LAGPAKYGGRRFDPHAEASACIVAISNGWFTSTQAFDRNAQTAVIRLGGWVKSTLRIPTMGAPTQTS
jgi:hypothetical protein